MLSTSVRQLGAGVGFVRALAVRQLTTQQNEATFQTRPYKLHKLDNGPKEEVTVTRDEALQYYREMQVIRRMETTAGNLYKEKKIRGFCHLYTGQEAVAVGICAAKDEEDAVITSYRCHGWTYLMGSTVAEVLSELTGRITGNVYGKGGSMHMYERNFYGGNGIVGAQIPVGAGVALAMKYRNQKNVCYTLYGDGAANQGQFFEAANMAKLWDLPCVFNGINKQSLAVCENNGFGMGTSAARSSASTDYYMRGDYVPGIWVDAMDVLSVRESIRFAREHCTSGKGPLVMEMATYRYVGHSMSDPGTRKDKLITSSLATEDELKAIDKQVRKEVDEATQIATTEDVLPAEALYADLYEKTPAQRVRGCTVDETIEQPFLTTTGLLKSIGRKAKEYANK